MAARHRHAPNPRLRKRDTLLLAGLFVVHFAVPVPQVHVPIASVYVALALAYGVAHRRAIRAADVLGNLRTVHLVRRVRAGRLAQWASRPR